MKTILLMTAVLVLAGCGGERQNTTSGADTTGMAPATTDTAAMQSDTTMARDTAH